MIRKIVPFVVLALFLVIVAMTVMGGANRYGDRFSLSITGHATANDSVVVDTIELVNTLHFKNRYHLVVHLDSLRPTEGVAGGDFGDVDSVGIVVKSNFDGKWLTIDSTKTAWLNVPFTSASVIDGGTVDSLYGDNLMLIIRIADTVGVVTDSTVTFRGRYNLYHAWAD